MSIVDDLPSKTPTLSRIWLGIIKTTPTSTKQLINIIIKDLPHKQDINHELLWKNCYWQPRVYPTPQEDKVRNVEGGMGGSVSFEDVPLANYLFPKINDPCLCIFDNYRRIWVVMWWPK